VFNKIYHIAKREFQIRVRKKSFWIMTFLGPIIMAALMIVPIWLTIDKSDSNIIVVSGFDDSMFQSLPKIEGLSYVQNNEVHASSDSILKWFNAEAELKIENEAISFNTQVINSGHEQLLRSSIENYLLKKENKASGLPSFNVKYLQDKASGRAVQELMSYGMSIAVYFFIFMYGVQVMKGVVEEKTNRIIEVMLCTVKPFELMMGKIAGISVVGFLQFFLWIGLVLGFESIVSGALNLDQLAHVDLNSIDKAANLEVLQGAQMYLSILTEMNLPLMLISYLWFFLFGFLLYSALFAVIGSASDVDTDTQQFIFPITVPLFGTMLLAQKVVESPHGFVAEFLSIFPFTSPLAMSMRLPFANSLDYFWLEVFFSSIVLFVFFVGVVWVASRIYRIGILSYGSKVGYSQLIKWFFEKD
jgi:ABC-2 type transport system permease protein